VVALDPVLTLGPALAVEPTPAPDVCWATPEAVELDAADAAPVADDGRGGDCGGAAFVATTADT
jgi:hypothetical protein